MWDLDTLKRINRKAVQLAEAGKPSRSAVFLATGNIDPMYPFLKDEPAVKEGLVSKEKVDAFLDRLYGNGTC